MLASCGRVAFDVAGSDADGSTVCATPVGHDEDADTVDDACDVCPHLHDAGQADGDGDGVGDACDPRPADAGERIVYFDPFVVRRPEWAFTIPVTYANDQLEIDASTGAGRFYLSTVPVDDVYELAGTIINAAPVIGRQLTLYADQGPPIYYCDLYDDLVTPKWQISSTYDLTQFDQLAIATGASPLTGGAVRITLDHRPPNLSCSTTLPATPNTLVAPIPAGIAPTSVGFRVQRIHMVVDYFIQIHTDR